MAAESTQVIEEMEGRRIGKGYRGNGGLRNRYRLSRKWWAAELAKVIEEMLGSAQTQVIDGMGRGIDADFFTFHCNYELLAIHGCRNNCFSSP